MFLDQVKKTIQKYRMLSQGDRVIVGVSGGMDSVALLCALHKVREVYGVSLVVGHLNHGLRGKESLRDAEFVRKMALDLNLPYETESLAAGELKKKGMTIQEAAREARFVFFRRLVRQYKAHKIALGQNADDQAETIVMRFLRGSGVTGLRGIPPVRDEFVIHPLIEVGRKEIEAYLAREGLLYVEDSSNLKDDYLRNRVRRHLIPILENYNPNLKTVLGRMGKAFLHEDRYMSEKTQEAWDRIVREKGGEVSLDLVAFRKLNPALQFRLLGRSLKAVSEISAKRLGTSHILNLAGIAGGVKPHAVIHLPGQVFGKRVYDRLEIRKGKEPSFHGFDLELAFPGVTPLEELGKKMVIRFVNRIDLKEASPQIAFMDFGRLKPPLRVRNYRPGDRFRPLGMGGRKKVKDCFIDWKVPMEERPRVPLILSEGAIVWVAGYRISEDVRVTPQTERVVHMAFQDL